MLIKIPKGWEISENRATSELDYANRREFIKKMGLVGAGALTLMSGCVWATGKGVAEQLKEAQAHPLDAPRNANFAVDGAVTDEKAAASYNNFYEFTNSKSRVWKLVRKFQERPWEIAIGGLVENPMTVNAEDLIKRMPLEERVYRFRCVEAWAMIVPWIGFPMKALLDLVQPKSSAKYERMLAFLRPDEAPHQNDERLPWPYFEGLTIKEAVNELTLLATGIYGHVLPKQHGAPIRLITPWKYGFKSIKSIVSIQFTDRKPRTFWNTLAPREYDFSANVNPTVPHPRWSQATERLIGTQERRRSNRYNGYERHVAHLYNS